MRLLLDEMYGSGLANALRSVAIDAVTVTELGMAGASDADVFAAATATERVVVTENVADYTRLAADLTSQGRHHHGVLVALGSRFSRRPEGTGTLTLAIQAVRDEPLDDRVVYLRTPRPR